jgi:hypothetical protein
MNDSDASDLTTNWEKFKKVVKNNQNIVQSSNSDSLNTPNQIPVVVNNQPSIFQNPSFGQSDLSSKQKSSRKETEIPENPQKE